MARELVREETTYFSVVPMSQDVVGGAAYVVERHEQGVAYDPLTGARHNYVELSGHITPWAGHQYGPIGHYAALGVMVRGENQMSFEATVVGPTDCDITDAQDWAVPTSETRQRYPGIDLSLAFQEGYNPMHGMLLPFLVRCVDIARQQHVLARAFGHSGARG